MVVTSEPSGAELYFNYQYVGQTPAEFDLEWFWYHQFTLYKDGYDTVDEKVRIRAPFYLWPPIDLFWEILPVRITYRRKLHFDMEEKEVLDIF